VMFETVQPCTHSRMMTSGNTCRPASRQPSIAERCRCRWICETLKRRFLPS